jgi:hypothetical protein
MRSSDEEMLRVLTCLMMVALVTATSASSHETTGSAGISVTVKPVVALPYYAASGVTAYIVVTSATWSPPAVRTEGAIYVRTCSEENPTKRCAPAGSPRVMSFGTGGAVPHTSEAHGGLLALAAGMRVSIMAHWRAYTPLPAGALDGEKDSSPYELSVPGGLPPRFKDATKLALADSGVTMYAECGSLSTLGGASASVPGLGVVASTMGGLACSSGGTSMQLSFDPVDPRFRAIVKPSVPPTPKVGAAGELTAAAATLFNRLFAARVREIGYGRAVVTSINRAQGAQAKRQSSWEEKQMRAAGRFASVMAAALDDEVRLRRELQRALAGTGLADATVSEDDVASFRDGLIRHGLPGGLASRLSGLGVARAEQGLARGWLLASDSSRLVGAPLAEVANPRLLASLRKTAAGLREFARKAARKPLETGS